MIAAEQFHAEACFDLAVSYEIGVGVKKNLPLAFKYYQKAALLGDKQSIYETGRCYVQGNIKN
ncbi:tetratricopeptide repeat protein [Mucilaginibacter sp.]|uniref:tetratricopeptide repeat protein n=1 Tax=Mucilaginibacter sp. TaxID=1882438 RepID=UPI0039C94450